MNYNNSIQYDFYCYKKYHYYEFSIFANEFEIIMVLNKTSLLLRNILENKEYRGEIENYNYDPEKNIFNENFSTFMIFSSKFDFSIYNVEKVNTKLVIKNKYTKKFELNRRMIYEGCSLNKMSALVSFFDSEEFAMFYDLENNNSHTIQLKERKRLFFSKFNSDCQTINMAATLGFYIYDYKKKEFIKSFHYENSKLPKNNVLY